MSESSHRRADARPAKQARRMVQEVRHLFFSGKEVVDALDGFRARNPDFLPSGVVHLKGVAKDGSVRVDVAMSYGVRAQKGSFDIATGDVLKTLICACADLGIPLPKEGRKSLGGSVAGIVLKIRLDRAAGPGGGAVPLETFSRARRIEHA